MSLETDRIEADLNASRHRLNSTLEQLGSKLSPGQMLDEVLGLAQGQAGQFTANLGRQVRDNPLPSVLVAAGIGMMLLQSRNSASHDDDTHHERRYRSLEEARWATPRTPNETDDAYNERVHQAYARALDLKQRADEAAHDFAERVKHTVEGIQYRATNAGRRVGEALSDAKHFTGDQARKLAQGASSAKHRAEDFYQETPLAAGAIALAVGALVGGLTPLSQPEREGLRDVAGKAARTGADLAERGARMVEDSIDRPVH